MVSRALQCSVSVNKGCTQAAHGRSHSRAIAENRRSSDKDIGPGRSSERCGCFIDTSVYLYLTERIKALDHLTDTLDLWQRAAQEVLMSEAWIDSHDHYRVQVGQNLFQHGGGGCWIDDHSRAPAEILDAVHCAIQIVVAFPVHKKRIGSGLDEFVKEKIRIRDHEVCLQREASYAP